jgi:hypothetical protein
MVRLTSDCGGRAEIALVATDNRVPRWPTGLSTGISIVCGIHHTVIRWWNQPAQWKGNSADCRAPRLLATVPTGPTVATVRLLGQGNSEQT